MRRRDPFVWWVVGAFALAVAVRWLVFLRWYRDLPIGDLNDNVFYHESANLLADGEGFVNPWEFRNGESVPTAAHPPGFTTYLAVWSFLGLDTVSWHRLAGGFVSALVVVPIGLVVRRLAGMRAAIAGMALAAVYPPLWMNDGLILSESLFVTIAGFAIWQAHRVVDEPSLRRILELTLILALGALTRSEPFLLFFFLLTPLVMFHPRLEWKQRFGYTAVAALVAMLTLAPWVGRNLTTFDDPTFLAVGPGYVLEIANCDRAYSGTFLGYWHDSCGSNWPDDPDADESVIGTVKLEAANEYINDHLGEVPKVVAARIGRVFGLYRPAQTADFDVLFERRVESHVQLGRWLHYAVMTAAVAGLVILRRRGESILPTLAVILTAVWTAAITMGITRYRVGADVAFVVLAAVTIGWLLDRWWPRSEPESPVVAEPDPEPTLEPARPEASR